ncbi:DUF1338 domain-containing protein [Catenovulum sp. SM1970]|uniref:DUF1338 domain-containing protein n=1 Tax=Marinifaba aquimaris TaxID=2741323 RepID=UPI001573C1FE|nr:DUF1338 domain-containing protein [Marinifaba aquimaris]NTS78873.1 DUF1338 domain-containing protein [Marinifaba aquimaris]
MHNSVDALFTGLWQDFCQHAPSAEKIHALLASKNEAIVNDHIALRTFNLSPIGLDTLAAHFLHLGYQAKGEYHFKTKKLYARHFEHPDPLQPKVFISELLVEQVSPQLQTLIKGKLAKLDSALTQQDSFLYSGRAWDLSTEEYQLASQESEYAAWLLAHGFRANHFTVSVNHLTAFEQLSEVNDELKQAGFALNKAGGEIKGGADVMLAQSSTLADVVDVHFADKTMAIPGCFYEFAQRFRNKKGQLYTGFVEASADKIFQSTDQT